MSAAEQARLCRKPSSSRRRWTASGWTCPQNGRLRSAGDLSAIKYRVDECRGSGRRSGSNDYAIPQLHDRPHIERRLVYPRFPRPCAGISSYEPISGNRLPHSWQGIVTDQRYPHGCFPRCVDRSQPYRVVVTVADSGRRGREVVEQKGRWVMSPECRLRPQGRFGSWLVSRRAPGEEDWRKDGDGSCSRARMLRLPGMLIPADHPAAGEGSSVDAPPPGLAFSISARSWLQAA